MKLNVIALTIGLMSICAVEAQVEVGELDMSEVCESVSKSAAVIMLQRQRGTPIDEVINSIHSQSASPDLMIEITNRAYKTIIHPTAQHKQIVQGFQKQILDDCPSLINNYLYN